MTRVSSNIIIVNYTHPPPLLLFPNIQILMYNEIMKWQLMDMINGGKVSNIGIWASVNIGIWAHFQLIASIHWPKL